MNKKTNRKGFTITELIIVIVVIAILASVLIPAFSGIIEKAHKSADLQLLRNAYIIVETEKTLKGTVTKEEALAALAESGISSLELSSDDYAIYWDPTNMNFALYDNEKGEVVMPEGAVKTDNWELVNGDEVPAPSADPEEPTDPPADPEEPTDPSVEQDDPGITVETVTFNQQTDAVTHYLANANYNGSYTSSYFDNSPQYGVNSSNLPNGYTFTLDSAMGIDSVIVTDSDNTKQYYAGAVDSTEYKVYNLVPGKTYKFIFKNGDAQKRIVKLTVTGQVRQIFTYSAPATGTGAQNIRDLGGWSIPNGSVQYGKIYRSAKLDNLNQQDIALLKEYLGIACVIDLRAGSEAKDGLNLGSGYVNNAVSATQYKENLQSPKDVDKQAYTTVINCVLNDKPVLFHCSAGADRTGTVAFMLEALLGVAQNDLDRDYELTILSRYDTQTKVTYNPNNNPEKGYAAMVAYLKDTYGSNLEQAAFRWFNEKIGISAENLNTFKTKMTAGTANQYQPVTLELPNAASSNTATVIAAGGAYTTTLTAASGYELETVTVTMGGADITATAYTETGVVSIPSVTSPVKITVVTKVVGASYTNVAAGKYEKVNKYLGADFLGQQKDESASIINIITDRIGGFVNKAKNASTGAAGTTIRISGVAEEAGRNGHTRMQIIYKDLDGTTDKYTTISDCMDNNAYYTVTYSNGVFTLEQKAKLEFTGGNIPAEVEIIFCFYNTNSDNLIITINEEIN